MKILKTLGLLLVVAAALLAFAGSASAAPTLTSPSGTEYTGTIHATLQSGTSTLIKAGIEDTCTESTASGTVSTNNETNAEEALSTLTLGKCTQHTLIIITGFWIFDNTGALYASGLRIEIIVTGIATCFYGQESGSPVKIGTLTGGTTAKLAVNTTTLQRLSGSNTFFCASAGTWTGSYVVTTPDTLLVK